jgi:thiol-disulfide isomerase/thioredoxin
MQLHVMIQKVESEHNHRFYVLFTGSKNELGSSWCPDCVRAEPLIMKALESLDEVVTLLVVHVDREPYRNPEYTLRRDPRINLRCVPTLMKWERGEAVLRLNDVQCQNCHAVEEFLSN